MAGQEDKMIVEEDSEDRVAVEEDSEDGVAVEEDSGSESPWMWVFLGVVLAVLLGVCCWGFRRNPESVRDVFSLQGC